MKSISFEDLEPGIKLLAVFGFACLLFGLMDESYIEARLRFALNPPAPTSGHSALVARQATTTPDTLAIPSLGIEAPIIYATGTSEAVFQSALKRGVVHYPGTALPGAKGNTFIFGHSSDYVWNVNPYRNIFALLPQIKIGARILVSDPTGRLFEYRVTGTRIVPADDLQALRQGDKNIQTLTLQTSYPLGTALRRFLVQAEAVSPTSSTTGPQGR